MPGVRVRHLRSARELAWGPSTISFVLKECLGVALENTGKVGRDDKAGQRRAYIAEQDNCMKVNKQSKTNQRLCGGIDTIETFK